MASALESLAAGLRGAGGVLNPQVQQLEEQDRRQQEAVAEQRRNMLAQLTIKGAEAGSIDPVKATQTLKGLGIEVPEGAIGPTPEALQRKQAYNNEIGFRDAYSKLGPGATSLDLARIATQYGKPELAMQMYQREEDRITRAQEKADRLAEQGRQFDATLAEKALAREDRARAEEARNETKRQERATREEIARMRAAVEESKAQNIKDEKIRKETIGLGKALQQANLPEADAVLGEIEKRMKDNPELAEWITGPKMAVPDFAVSPEVREARQAFRRLENATLKLRSGATVTPQELDRLKAEFGVGLAKGPDQVMNAIKLSREIIQKHYRSVAAGYGPDVLKAYNENLGSLGGSAVIGAADDDPLGIRKK